MKKVILVAMLMVILATPLSSCDGVQKWGWKYNTRGEQEIDNKLDEALAKLDNLADRITVLSKQLKLLEEAKKAEAK
jgi:cell division protein FtsL